MREFPSHININGRLIGPGEPCYIIAEGGVSHFGQIAKAFQLIDMTIEAGADVFKTQHYKTDTLVGPSAPDWRNRLRSKELPDEAIAQMRDYCLQNGMPFLCTPHDEDVLPFLADELKIAAFKVGSGELENWPFLEKIAGYGRPVILSTGMHEMEQIEASINVLRTNGCKELAVLHCITNYPAAPECINLSVMQQIREFFPGPVGYSDHTIGTAVPLAAVALGANILEKHITIDKNIPDAQDWKVSCDPSNFNTFVSAVRIIEKAIRGGRKLISENERDSIKWARKSITTAIDIPQGVIITKEMLKSQRPGTGISPARINEIIGKSANRIIKNGEILKYSDLESD